MKISKISVNEEQKDFNVTLENGNTYRGFAALNKIKIYKNNNGLEAHIDWRDIKFLNKNEKYLFRDSR